MELKYAGYMKWGNVQNRRKGMICKYCFKETQLEVCVDCLNRIAGLPKENITCPFCGLDE